MSQIDESVLTAEERALYGPRADVLIPNAEGMPAASEVNVHTEWIDQALAARPDLLAPFREALQIGSASEPEAAIEALHGERAELFDAFSVLTAGAYLMHPEVKKLIGYPGQEERPVTSDDTGDYIGMLEEVVMRGPVFRPTVLR